MSCNCVITLVRNPWPETVPDNTLLHFLTLATADAVALLERMVDHGEVRDDQDSFAAVLLDPTRPREAPSLADRIMATIEIGPNASAFLANAAAKADAHDRHGVMNGILVSLDNHLLADGEFGWGNSAVYRGAIGGGSGLSVDQDAAMTMVILMGVIDSVSSARKEWLQAMRDSKPKSGHRWFSNNDKPADRYSDVAAIHYAGRKTFVVCDPRP